MNGTLASFSIRAAGFAHICTASRELDNQQSFCVHASEILAVTVDTEYRYDGMPGNAPASLSFIFRDERLPPITALCTYKAASAARVKWSQFIAGGFAVGNTEE